MRKQAFASVCLFGKDDDSTISGVWVWRGQKLAFEVSLYRFIYFYIVLYNNYGKSQENYLSPIWKKLNIEPSENESHISFSTFCRQGGKYVCFQSVVDKSPADLLINP